MNLPAAGTRERDIYRIDDAQTRVEVGKEFEILIWVIDVVSTEAEMRTSLQVEPKLGARGHGCTGAV